MRFPSAPRRARARPRAGLAPRTVVLAVAAGALALLAALLLAARLGRGGEGAERAARPARPGPAAAAPAGTADGPKLAAGPEGAAALAAPRDLAVPAGVRLPGSGRLEGRVVERASGAGVGGARVDLLALPPAGQAPLSLFYRIGSFPEAWVRRLSPVATERADAGGRFAFEGVREGVYFLEARAERHVPDETPLVRVDPRGAGGPVRVHVLPGARVVGRVTRPDGAPVRGADVYVYPGPTRFVDAARTGDLRRLRARTDEDGRYAVPGVAPGPGYDVTVLAPGFAPTHVLGLEVRAGEDARADVVVRAGGRIAGVVLTRGAGDGEPTPLAGAHVSAVPRGLREISFVPEITARTESVTDASGRYVLAHVPPGEIDVVAVAPGHLLAHVGPVASVEGLLGEAPPLELERGPTVRVVVSDGDGRPVEGARVLWWVSDYSRGGFDASLTPFLLQVAPGFAYPATDAHGVALAGPFPGRPPYSLSITAEGHEWATADWDPARDGEELEVVLRRGRAVEGIVMDVERAAPVPAFHVRADARIAARWEEPTGANVFSGGTWVEAPDGRFRIEGVASGEGELVFSAPGYLPESVAVDVPEDADVRGLIVRLRSGGTVRGRVVDAEGEPVAGAHVAALGADGRPLERASRAPRGRTRSRREAEGREFVLGSMELAGALGVLGEHAATSGEDGTFELQSVPEGTVVVHAIHRDHADGASEPIAVAAGAPVEGVEVVLRRGGGIEGFVEDRRGRPVPGAIVLALSPTALMSERPSARSVHQGGTDASGAYRIAPLPAGQYFLLATRGDEALHLARFLGTMNLDLVTVPEDEVVRFDLVDSSAAGVRVSGRVLEAGGPVSGGGLAAVAFGADSVLGVDLKIAQVRRDGSFEFEGLAPGDYLVSYDGDAPGETSFDLHVPDVPELVIDVELPSAVLDGRAVDAATGEPIPGAMATLRRPLESAPGGWLGTLLASEGRSTTRQADARGRFEFTRLQAGEYELRVAPPLESRGSWAPAEPLRIEVAERARAHAGDVPLEPALRLSGVVLTDAGEPVHRAEVRAFARGDALAPPLWTRTDRDGRFELGGLFEGEWVLVASDEGRADAPPAVVQVARGAPVEVELVLPRGIEVLVRVLGPDGAPLQGALGRLVRVEAPIATAQAGADGTFRRMLDGELLSGPDGRLALGLHGPGEYRLEVRRGGLSGALEVELAPGPPVELEIRLAAD